MGIRPVIAPAFCPGQQRADTIKWLSEVLDLYERKAHFIRNFLQPMATCMN
jgi:hypothetical protein